MVAEEVLKKIFWEKFRLNISLSQYDESLFSQTIGLKARNLVDVLFELEKQCAIKIPESTLLRKQEMTTFNGLVRAAERILEDAAHTDKQARN